jgi:tetratricopeptide (TPR) repeat protein
MLADGGVMTRTSSSSRRRRLLSVFVFVAAIAAASPARALDRDRVLSILDRAMSTPDDAAALGARLTELEAELGGKTDDAAGEYVRGWILSHMGRPDDGLAAYDRAVAADPKLAEGWYNAGVVLTGLGRKDEAIERFKRAWAVDPKAVDAAYNLGQLLYNRGDFQAALEWWLRAQSVAPDDFGVAKKLVQAHNALGKREEAAAARTEVFRIHRTSRDAAVRGLEDYCFDQFDVGSLHVYAYETFEPSGKDAVLYTFLAATPAGKARGTLRVRGAASGEGGVRLEIEGRDEAPGKPVALDELPDYPALKKRIRALMRERFSAEPI